MGLDASCRTPFFWACARGRKETAHMLADYNHSVLSVADASGETPLRAAQRTGNHDLVSRIIAAWQAKRRSDSGSGNSVKQKKQCENFKVFVFCSRKIV